MWSRLILRIEKENNSDHKSTAVLVFTGWIVRGTYILHIRKWPIKLQYQFKMLLTPAEKYTFFAWALQFENTVCSLWGCVLYYVMYYIFRIQSVIARNVSPKSFYYNSGLFSLCTSMSSLTNSFLILYFVCLRLPNELF